MLRKLTSRLIGALLISVLFIANSSADDTSNWDQAKATKLSDVLISSIENMIKNPALHKEQPSALIQRKFDAAIADFKVLQEDAIILNNHLKAGKGYTFTLPVFKRINHLRIEIKAYTTEAKFTQSILSNIEITGGVMDELTLLYKLN